MKLDWAFDITGTKLKAYAIAFVALVLLFVIVAVGSFFAGKRDQKDAQAASDVIELKEALRQAATDLKIQQATLAEQLIIAAEAQQRMTAIAQRAEQQQQAQEQLSNELKSNFERALRARPDLNDVRVGADILCAWNTANAGANSSRSAGAHASAAIPGCKPASALPKPAAGAKRLPRQPAPKPAGSG